MANALPFVYERHMYIIYIPSVSKGSSHKRRKQEFLIHERNNQNNKSSTTSRSICKKIPDKPHHTNRSNGPLVHITSSVHCKWNTLSQSDFTLIKLNTYQHLLKQSQGFGCNAYPYVLRNPKHYLFNFVNIPDLVLQDQ